ncbi:MAG: two-component system, chemotaxis family, CheB/CheR fusion protein [Candidatus Binataceae bacterium]|nr:two-component system, chemotaxis family, CheB/CheR fusion protein [Candidatus Binataceae bacterium]
MDVQIDLYSRLRSGFEDVYFRTRSVRRADGHELDIVDKTITSDQLFRAVAEASPNGVFLIDPSGRISFANRRLNDLLGIATDDAGEDRHWLDRFHPEDRDEVERTWRDGILHRHAWSYECRVVSAERNVKWIKVSGYPYYSDDGGLLGFCKGKEAVATRNEERWHRLVESKLFGVVITDEERVLDANQVYLDMIGYTPAELHAGKILRANLTPGEFKPLDDRGLEELRVTGSSMPYEKEYRRKDGTRVPVLLGSTTLTEEPLTWIGFVVDLTEHRRTQKALRESEEQLRALTKASPVFLFTMQPSGECTFASEYYYEFTGRPKGAAEGVGWLDAIESADRAKMSEAWEEARAAGKPLEGEYRLGRADGVYRWFKVRAIPVRDETGKIGAWYGGGIDIDDQKQVEEALREADRRKNEFVAMLAHELRNPLAPIVNSIASVEDLAIPDGRLSAARKVIERQVRYLTRIVDDLLDVTRVTTGKIQLRKEPVQLAGVIEQAIESARPMLEGRKHRIEVSLPDCAVAIDGDVVRLTQVLLNLIDNAAKYTPEGGTIELRLEQGDGDAVIRVRDNGIGIAPKLLPYIFDLFTQAERTPDRSSGGLGIGLTVVRSLVELHGGRVDAVSEGLGRGSEFIVRLPLTEAPAPGVEAQEGVRPDAAHLGQRILVVDDNTDHIESLCALLEMSGFEAASASDGQRALEVIKSFRPQIVLLDIGLPDLDGYTIAKRIRQMPGGREVVMIAVTGYNRTDDRKRAVDAGFNHHLVKPVDFDQLLSFLSENSSRKGVDQ